LKRLRISLLAIAALAVVLSLVTSPSKSNRSRDPLLPGGQIDPQVLAILEKACQNCHSERTTYPWYSYIAPVSWFIESDVSRGRAHLNLSRWNEYSRVRQERSLSEIANQVKDRDMPLWSYTMMHREARLSDSEVAALFRWTQTERSRLIEESLRLQESSKPR